MAKHRKSSIPEMFKNYTPGALKSPYDSRDWVAETIFPAKEELNIPVSLDLRTKMLAVRNQGAYPTCVAFAASAMKEYQENIDVKLNSNMSPTFLYLQRSNIPESGMYLRDVCEILKKAGCCKESDLPYNTVQNKTDIKQSTYEVAKNYSISSYAQVYTVDGLKTALYKNGPCLIAFPIYNYGLMFWKQEFKEQPALGGHAVLVVGYDKTGFIIRNSWGIGWGNAGYTTYPYEHFGCHWEIFCSIDAKSSVIDTPDSKLCC